MLSAVDRAHFPVQAIGLDGSRVDVGRAMEAVSRFGPRGEGGGATFIAGNVINTVQRSRYGKRAAQNMTRDLRPARSLVTSTGGSPFFPPTFHYFLLMLRTVDPETKRKLDQITQDARQALEVINEAANVLAEEDRNIRAEDGEFKKKLVCHFCALYQKIT